jgi:hypothetical protein
MLFMTIYTFEPANRDAIIKRRAEKGPMVPAGAKIVGEWSSLVGHRVFRLVEVDDPRAMLAATYAVSDLGKIEAFPVMPMEEVMKVVTAKK